MYNVKKTKKQGKHFTQSSPACLIVDMDGLPADGAVEKLARFIADLERT
jgi:hypothetical protein